jgi:hypothetical protein
LDRIPSYSLTEWWRACPGPPGPFMRPSAGELDLEPAAFNRKQQHTWERSELLTIVGVESTAHHDGRHRLTAAVVLWWCLTSHPLAALDEVVGGTLNLCNIMSVAATNPGTFSQLDRANSHCCLCSSSSYSGTIGLMSSCCLFLLRTFKLRAECGRLVS